MLNDKVNNSIESYLAYDDLLIALNDLYDECQVVGKKYKLLKKKHASIVSEFDKLRNEHDDSMLASCTKFDEIDSLKKENALLQKMLENFKIERKEKRKKEKQKKIGRNRKQEQHQNLTIRSGTTYNR